MAKNPIGWCDITWNPVTGCTPISEACDHCYAKRMAHRLKGRFGYPADEPFRVTLHHDRLEEPGRWRKHHRVFVVSMGDLFHPDVPTNFIHKVLSTCHYRPRHTFLFLTKRPRRILEEFSDMSGGGFWTPNMWLGVTVENQARLDERVWHLLQIPAAKHFISYEPALGPIKAERWLKPFSDFPSCMSGDGPTYRKALDWVIAGGESGPRARPSHPDWFRSVRDQCQAAGVPFWFKGWGEWAPNCLCDTKQAHKAIARPQPGKQGVMFHCGKKRAGRLLDSREWNGVPT